MPTMFQMPRIMANRPQMDRSGAEVVSSVLPALEVRGGGVVPGSGLASGGGGGVVVGGGVGGGGVGAGQGQMRWRIRPMSSP